MGLRLQLFTLFASAAASALAGAQPLTTTETLWLKAASPVIAHARAASLQIDVIVQPDVQPASSPISLGYANGRCLLVLTMRGNPAVDALLDGLDAALRPVAMQAIAAHELAHCRRHAQGHWFALPANFVDTFNEDGMTAALAQRVRNMRGTRREEAYADLAALAWTRHHHPAEYRAVHAWLSAQRNDQPVAGAHHDTRAWLALVAEGSVFDDVSDPFAAAARVWERGLTLDP